MAKDKQEITEKQLDKLENAFIMADAARTPISLGEAIPSGEDTAMIAEQHLLHDVIVENMKKMLSPRNYAILEDVYFHGHTQEEAGFKYRIDSTRVCQIDKKFQEDFRIVALEKGLGYSIGILSMKDKYILGLDH